MNSVALVNLGCPKNQIDAETMLGLLSRAGYLITTRLEKAEIIIVNTCGFIEQATQESVDKILEVAQYKQTGCCRKLVVAGCLSQRYRHKLPQLLPEVDAFIGTGSVDKVLEVVATGSSLLAHPSDYLGRDEVGRMYSTFPYGFLKIAEGCNNHCSYCVIPCLRGKLRSKPQEQILTEAGRMVASGIRELVLIAQDTAAYGSDWDNDSQLLQLLRRLETVPDLGWLRLLYCYPDHIDTALMDWMAQSKTLCHYLDIPLQHSHPHILTSMGRQRNTSDLEGLIYRLRERVPGIALRTTFIVGYPGETEAHFEHLLDFVRTMEFEHLGAFLYSREEGTRAARLPNQVDEDEKARRYQLIMETQQKIVLDRNNKARGDRLKVLVDSAASSDRILNGRSYAQAPEIDNKIIIAGCVSKPGTFIEVEITGHSGYDLHGVTR